MLYNSIKEYTFYSHFRYFEIFSLPIENAWEQTTIVKKWREKWALSFAVNAVLNLSDKLQVTSKCGKHKKVALVTFWRHPLSFVEQVQGNTESVF